MRLQAIIVMFPMLWAHSHVQLFDLLVAERTQWHPGTKLIRTASRVPKGADVLVRLDEALL